MLMRSVEDRRVSAVSNPEMFVEANKFGIPTCISLPVQFVPTWSSLALGHSKLWSGKTHVILQPTST